MTTVNLYNGYMTTSLDPPIGTTFNNWNVLGYSHRARNGHYWNCRCECGTERPVLSADLIAGRSKNCGCVRRRKVGDRNRTHGLTETPEYVLWCGMIARCGNPNHVAYHLYGGRGISVCQRWRDSFEAFLEDMGPRPQDQAYNIDRINNDGNYEPGNCHWVTPSENARNKRSTRWMTLNGVAKSMAEWAEVTGIPRATISNRVNNYGWTDQEALTTPLMTTEEIAAKSKAARVPLPGNRTRDLSGQQFGDWSVSDEKEIRDGVVFWMCQCKCGVRRFVRSAGLVRGTSTGCGCTKGGQVTHGATGTKLYTAWTNMRHGSLARGETIHPPWIESFDAFLNDVGEPPSPKHRLRRFNKSMPYEPGNVRWLLPKKYSRSDS